MTALSLRRRLAGAFLLAFVATSTASFAEVITPPRLLDELEVSYPAQALAEGFDERTEVVVILEVDTTGSVVAAAVETPLGRGFDAAALDAARALRFAPALRDGTPVAARIKVRFVFDPPEPTEPAEPPSPPIETPRAEPDEPPPSAPPVEVVVAGERTAPAVSSYSRAEVRQIPGAFGDPFRAIETLPGVTPIASGLPFFYVRGAPPGNVGYFYDGVRVPYLYHVAFGPSVVHPGLVERVDLHPGGYPARFGRFAGGIVAAEATAPNPTFRGEGNLRLFDVGGMVEAGHSEGRGSVLLGGRYSYTAALLSLAAPEVRLEYRDYQARAAYDLTPDHRVTVFSFGAYDLLAEEKNGVSNVLFGTEFYRVDLRHDHTFSSGSLRTALTLGYDRTSAGPLAGEQRNVVDRSIGARSELGVALAAGALLRTGADVAVDEYGMQKPRYRDPDNPETRDFERQFPARTDVAGGAWLDCVLDVAPGIEVTPGVRLDLYRSGSASAVGIDPRVAARFAVSDDVRVIHAYGLAHQPPAFAIPIPGIVPATLDDGLQKSFQTSAGVEVDLGAAVTSSLTLFHNAFFDMTDALDSAGDDGPPDFAARSSGSAVGAELLVRRRLTERLGGFLSYTLSRSSRSVGREEFPSSFDRTHVANAALSFDLGRAWRAGGRLVFYTGTPIQASANGALAPPRTQSPRRSTPFFRLDVRLEKRWPLGGAAWIALVTELMNATLNTEAFGEEEVGPLFIPSLGAEAGF